MSRRVRIELGVLVGVALAVLLYGVTQLREPVYNGKPLRYWLELSIAKGPTGADGANDVEAVRQIGAAAVPTLLEMAGVKDSSLKRRWIKWAGAHSFFHIRFHTVEDCRNMACFGFNSLGAAGRGAVPNLVKMLKATDWQTRVLAADCLGDIGPDAGAAVPDLVHFLSDSNRTVRWDATLNITKIHARADLAVPVLVANLSPTNSFLPTTVDALRSFGPDAQPAVPVLLTFLKDQNIDVRKAVTNALKAIDPDAVTKSAR